VTEYRVAPAPVPAWRALAIGIVLPFVAGAFAVGGFAPFYLWPLPLLSVGVLFFAWQASGSPLQAGLTGFAWGLGYFLTGVSWVFVSMHTYGGMPSVLAAIATFAFCAYLAAFPALAGWVAVRMAVAGKPGRRLLAAVAAMTLTEWLRGWLLTGFAWLGLGTSQIPGSALAGWAPYVGTYGVTLVACAFAALALALFRAWPIPRAVLFTALFALGIAGALLGKIAWTQPAGPSVKVALLQGNVPQQMKWEEDVRTRTLLDYRAMIFAADAPVVVVPETALPAFLDQLPPPYLQSLRDHARERGKDLFIGTAEREPPGRDGVSTEYYNSLVRIGADGRQASFRKRHLVPFGEFVPWGFRWFVDAMRIPMGDFSRGGKGQAPLLGHGIPFGVAICYEDIFGEEIIEQLPAAKALVNVSNDAWFGESWAADQHLQASQMRALETGRWMVRSTNTGASASIDPSGHVVGRLAPFTAGTLYAEVTPMEGLTPYARFGNWPAVLLALILLAVARRR
jgi:apolipoprotein N-acyltransferase